jgi:citrate synthase
MIKDKLIVQLFAETFKISEASVSNKLQYQQNEAWDSMAHVELLLRLEREFGRKITTEEASRLTTYQAVKDWIHGVPDGQMKADSPKSKKDVDYIDISRGLNGVYFDESGICRIDGQHGLLGYRGYSLEDLAEYCSYEQVAYLLIYERLPTAEELKIFCLKIQNFRVLPEEILTLIESLKLCHPTYVLRTVLSAIGAFYEKPKTQDQEIVKNELIRIIAQIQSIIVCHWLCVNNITIQPSHLKGNFCELLLSHFYQGEQQELAVSLLNADLVVHSEHGSNASTFATRVACGAQSDLHSIFTSAISVFNGDLHGGAIERVIEMITEIGHPDNVASYLEQRRASNLPIMGFGHRVYRTHDPRKRKLEQMTYLAAISNKDMLGYEIIQALEKEMLPYHKHGISGNVDLYAGLLYQQLNIPKEYSVPIFIASRSAGWAAHILEQQSNNILIRPRLHYNGPEIKRFTREERESTYV